MSGTSNTFNVIGTTSYFKVLVNPMSLRACTALAVGVTAFDIAGNITPAYHGPVSVVEAAGTITSLTLTWARGAGTGTVFPQLAKAKDTLVVTDASGLGPTVYGTSSIFAVTGVCAT